MIARKTLIAFSYAALLVASPPDAHGADADALERGRTKAILCSTCHGIVGRSPFPETPHLAGQMKQYLIAQLKAFRQIAHSMPDSGRRSHRHDAAMSHQALALTDREVEDLAAYFSLLPCGPRAAVVEATPALTHYCLNCHGAAGRSIIATVPHLAGQQDRYLQNQLWSFRDAARSGVVTDGPRGRVHPTMDWQAALLEDGEIRDLARYFATQSCN